MSFEMTELPAVGFVPPEQLQAWKDYNQYEIRLFSTLVFPFFDRFRLTYELDSVQLRNDFVSFFGEVPEEAQWRIQLIRDLKDWIDSSRIESPGAEPLYSSLEEIIEDSLGAPRGLEEVDASVLEDKSPSTYQSIEESVTQA